MRIIKFLILFATLYCFISVSSSITSPGVIEKSQLNDEPIVSYYGSGSMNGFYPIGGGCNKLSNNLPKDYMPIVILNETSYLATSFGMSDFEIVVVTSEGVNQVEIQSGLKNLASGGGISSAISYDDNLNSFIFVNRDGFTTNIVTYSIDKDSYTTADIKNSIAFPLPYYDLTQATYYVAAIVIGDLSYIVYTQDSMEVYSISDLNLNIDFDSVQVAGYNGKVVLFAKNSDSETSYLYLVDPSSQQSQLLLQTSYFVNMVTSVNPRYLLLTHQDGSDSMEFIDLQLNSTTKFTSVCPEFDSSNSFLSSIAIKDIFS